MRSVLRFACLATVAANSLRNVLEKRSDLTTFTRLLDQFEAWQLFSESSKDVMVMAPNNAAYETLLKIGLDLATMPADFTMPVLRYHLLMNRIESSHITNESDAILVQTALTEPNMTQPSPVKMFWQADELYAEGGLQLTTRIVEPDIEFSDGVVHVLDASLVAPHNISATVWMNGVGNEFLRVMEETGMVSEIESLHDASLFIPSNEAWQRSEAVLSTMSMDARRAVLRNHAVEGRLAYRKGLLHRQTLATIGGTALEVRVDEKGGITVEGAAVVQADILWFNGVAHMIDKVIMTEQINASSAMPVVDQSQQFLAESSAA